MALVISKTVRGKPCLVLNGYAYSIERTRNDLTYWACCKKRESKCKGRVVTQGHGSTTELKKCEDTVHNHQPAALLPDLVKRNAKLKEMAKVSADSPTSVIRRAKRNACADVIVGLPNDDAMRRRVKRVRAAQREYREALLGLEFLMPEPLKTLDGEPFLIGDYGYDGKRGLIFATHASLRHLVSCPMLCMDGTFKICPSAFRQLYTIHGVFEVNGKISFFPRTLRPVFHNFNVHTGPFINDVQP